MILHFPKEVASGLKDVRYSKAWKMTHFAFDALLYIWRLNVDIVMKNTLAWLFKIFLHSNLSLTMRLKATISIKESMLR